MRGDMYLYILYEERDRLKKALSNHYNATLNNRLNQVEREIKDEERRLTHNE